MKRIEPGDPRYKAVFHDPDLMIRAFTVSKAFGPRRALDGVDLEVRKGDLFGLIGSNGAGKTTFLRIAATLIEPTNGSVYVTGHSIRIWPEAVRRAIGYMPDSTGLTDRIRVGSYLEFFALLLKLPRAGRAARVAEVLEDVGLADRRREEVRALSRGMQQRLALARLLLRSAPVLLLDEPLSGLDPRARVEILELLRRMNRGGQTIVMSSHILYDVERFCNRLAILEEGKLRFCGTVADARAQVQDRLRYVVAVADRTAEAARALEGFDGVHDVSVAEGRPLPRILFRGRPPMADPAAAAAFLVGQGYRIRELGREEVTLHDVFVHYTEGKVS